MSRRGKTLLSVLVIVAVFGLLGYWLAADWSRLEEVRWLDRPGLLGIHVALLSGALWLLVEGWRHALRGMGVDCPRGMAAHTWLVPNLGKYVPGKVLMFAGRVELCHRLEIPRGVAVGALILELVGVVLAATPFLAIAVFGGAQILDQTVWIVIAVMVLTGSAILLRPASLTWLLRKASRLLRREFTAVPARGVGLGLLVVYLGLWLTYGAAGLVLVHALGFGSSVPGLVALAAFVAAWTLGFVSFITPGGLGVREAALVGLLSPFLSASEATALALVSRITWTVVEMTGAAVGIWIGARVAPVVQADGAGGKSG